MAAEVRAESSSVTAPPPCPTCRSVRVVPITYGFPGNDAWESSGAGRTRLGGCVLPAEDAWEDEWHCWACSDQEWLRQHAAAERRAGRTRHDCDDDGMLTNLNSDSNAVRLGWHDVSDRFRSPGFIDRLWPYLRDVPDGAPGWRPNIDRIAGALADDDPDPDPDHLTVADILLLVQLSDESAARLSAQLVTIDERLARIPVDAELHTLDTVSYERTVGLNSPSQALARLLESAAGISARTATRVAARKRPALLVPRHELVDTALGIPTDRQVWRPWWRTLTADPGLVKRLENLRTQLDTPGTPLLRIAWLSVLTREHDAAAAGGPSPSLGLPEPRWFRCPRPPLLPPSETRIAPIRTGSDPTRVKESEVEKDDAVDARDAEAVDDEGEDEGVQEPLTGVAIVERAGGGEPWCVVSSILERRSDGLSVLLEHNHEVGGWDPDYPEVVERLRIPLASEPRPDPRGAGHILERRLDDGSTTQLVLRPVVGADAAWLSRYGFTARLDVVVLETLAAKRARQDTRERMIVLGYRGAAPHALCYEVGDDRRQWFLSGEPRWRTDWRMLEVGSSRLRHAAQRVREMPWMSALAEQVEDVMMETDAYWRRFSSWTESGYRSQMAATERAMFMHLLANDVPRMEVQPWAVHHAVARMNFQANPLDELLFLLYCSPEDTRITPSAIGSDLTWQLREVGRTVDEEHREVHGDDAWSWEIMFLESLDEVGIAYDPDEHLHTMQQIAALAEGDFDLPVRALVELLHIYEVRE